MGGKQGKVTAARVNYTIWIGKHSKNPSFRANFSMSTTKSEIMNRNIATGGFRSDSKGER
jgi:hypothetical protein